MMVLILSVFDHYTCFSLMISTNHLLCYAAVPQARKASLARFLEKRKERLVRMHSYLGGRNISLDIRKTCLSSLDC